MSWNLRLGRGSRRGGNRRRSGGRPAILLVEARQAERRTEQMQRTGGWILLGVVLLGTLWAVSEGAAILRQKLLAENSLFELRRIDVQSDGRLTPELVRQYARITTQTNLFAIDIAQVRRHLAAVPIIRDVEIARRLPGELVLKVRERVPIAQFLHPEKQMLLTIDREGVITGHCPPTSPLPVIENVPATGRSPGQDIRDASVTAALQALQLCDSTRLCAFVQIRKIRVGHPDLLEIELQGGEQVRMPMAHIEAKLRRLASILKTIRDRNLASAGQPVVIDMTTDSSFPVTGLKI